MNQEKQAIEREAIAALLAVNLTWPCVALRVLGTARLSIATTHYILAERVLVDVGLVLVDAEHDDYMTHASVVRAKAGGGAGTGGASSATGIGGGARSGTVYVGGGGGRSGTSFATGTGGNSHERRGTPTTRASGGGGGGIVGDPVDITATDKQWSKKSTRPLVGSISWRIMPATDGQIISHFECEKDTDRWWMMYFTADAWNAFKRAGDLVFER